MSTLVVEIEVSGWANWIAVDKGGSVYEYECEPKKNRLFEAWVCQGGRNALIYRGQPPKDWEDELYTWDWV